MLKNLLILIIGAVVTSVSFHSFEKYAFWIYLCDLLECTTPFLWWFGSGVSGCMLMLFVMPKGKRMHTAAVFVFHPVSFESPGEHLGSMMVQDSVMQEEPQTDAVTILKNLIGAAATCIIMILLGPFPVMIITVCAGLMLIAGICEKISGGKFKLE